MKQSKIALIIDGLNGGGAEKVCLTLAEAMCQKGVDVHLIVLKRQCSYDVSQLHKTISLHFIFPQAKTKLYRRKNQRYAAQEIQNIAQSVGGFDVCFTNLEASYPILELADLANTHYVVHNAIEPMLRRTKKLGPLKYWRKLRSYKALDNKNVIAVSEGLADEVRRSTRFSAASVTSIYNPIPITSIRDASREPFSVPEWPYIIHVGRFAAQKRHDVLFEAFKKLDASLHLVLLCPASKKVVRAIERAGLVGRVHVAGFQQNPYPWIKHAQALALSSDFEGLAIVLLEALVCGTPVASTDCPYGPAEILSGALTQFLSPVGDAEALAGNLARAMRSPEMFANAEVVNDFAVERSVSQYLSLLPDASSRALYSPLP